MGLFVGITLYICFGAGLGYLFAEYRFSERETKRMAESMKAESNRHSWKDAYWD